MQYIPQVWQSGSGIVMRNGVGVVSDGVASPLTSSVHVGAHNHSHSHSYSHSHTHPHPHHTHSHSHPHNNNSSMRHKNNNLRASGREQQTPKIINSTHEIEVICITCK